MPLKDSNEFSFYAAPLGIPGNPLDSVHDVLGGLADTKRLRKWWAPGTKEPLEGHELPRFENPGITDVGSAGMHWDNVPQAPEELRVPDPVSATDPAFSMWPTLRALSPYPGATARASTTGGDSSWTQLNLKRPLRRSELISALGIPGLNLHYEDQGDSTIT